MGCKSQDVRSKEMEEYYDDFRYIDASVSTGSLASSEKSLIGSSGTSGSVKSAEHKHKLRQVAEKLGVKKKSVEFSDKRYFRSPSPVVVSLTPSPPSAANDPARQTDERISRELAAIFGPASDQPPSSQQLQKAAFGDNYQQELSICEGTDGGGSNGHQHPNGVNLNGDNGKTVMDNCGRQCFDAYFLLTDFSCQHRFHSPQIYANFLKHLNKLFNCKTFSHCFMR